MVVHSHLFHRFSVVHWQWGHKVSTKNIKKNPKGAFLACTLLRFALALYFPPCVKRQRVARAKARGAVRWLFVFGIFGLDVLLSRFRPWRVTAACGGNDYLQLRCILVSIFSSSLDLSCSINSVFWCFWSVCRRT